MIARRRGRALAVSRLGLMLGLFVSSVGSRLPSPPTPCRYEGVYPTVHLEYKVKEWFVPTVLITVPTMLVMAALGVVMMLGGGE